MGIVSQRAAENERLAEKLEQLHEESPDKGYRRLNDDLRHDCGIHVNDKQVLRICRVRDIRSTVKYNNRGCTKQEKNPQYLAENLLDRQFYAAKPNEKWLTDVTEFKWYEGSEIHKLYLSAILAAASRSCKSAIGGSGCNTMSKTVIRPSLTAIPLKKCRSCCARKHKKRKGVEREVHSP